MTDERSNHGSLWLGGILVALGLSLLLKNLGILSFDFIFKNLWAWALIAFGLLLVYKSFIRMPEKVKSATVDSTKGFVRAENTFGDLDVILDQRDFKGGHLRTVFGKLSVDGVGVAVSPGAYILHLEVTFGEIQVWLPQNMPVRIVANNVAGDMHIFNQKWDGLSKHVTWQSDSYDSSDSKLEIICSIVFGDIKIK